MAEHLAFVLVMAGALLVFEGLDEIDWSGGVS